MPSNRVEYELVVKNDKAKGDLDSLGDTFGKVEQKTQAATAATKRSQTSMQNFGKAVAGTTLSIAGALGLTASLSGAISKLKEYKDALDSAGEAQNQMTKGMMGLAVMNPQRTQDVMRMTAASGAMYGLAPDAASQIVEVQQGIWGSYEEGLKASKQAFLLAGRLGTDPTVATNVIKYGHGLGMSPEQASSLLGYAALESAYQIPEFAETMPGLAQWADRPELGAAIVTSLSDLMEPSDMVTALERIRTGAMIQTEFGRQTALKVTGHYPKFQELQAQAAKAKPDERAALKEEMGVLMEASLAQWTPMDPLMRLQAMREVLPMPEGGYTQESLMSLGMSEKREAKYIARSLNKIEQIADLEQRYKKRPLDYIESTVAKMGEDPLIAAQWLAQDAMATAKMQTMFGPQAGKTRAEHEARLAAGAKQGYAPGWTDIETGEGGWFARLFNMGPTRRDSSQWDIYGEAGGWVSTPAPPRNDREDINRRNAEYIEQVAETVPGGKDLLNELKTVNKNLERIASQNVPPGGKRKPDADDM